MDSRLDRDPLLPARPASTRDVAAFRALHGGATLLVLPNAWDAASAALARSAGARAIATTSAGVAWTCGYPDGEALPQAEHLSVIRAIKRGAADLPLTVDLEAGYANDPERVAAFACEVRALGAAGVNIEDGADAPGLLARKIAAIKAALGAAGDDLFVNARTDVYLRDVAAGPDAVREVSERARRYEAAGADGLFVPLLSDADAIAAISAATDLPLNVMLVPGLPATAHLHRLGVRRLSAGSAVAERAYGTARGAALAFLAGDALAAQASDAAIAYRDLNALFLHPTER